MTTTMKAMVFKTPGQPLELHDIPVPQPTTGQILIKIHACAVCRTDLHVVDGDLKSPKLPLVPGHEVIGTVMKLGATVTGFKIGERVGVPWLGSTCGSCHFCLTDQENLCEHAGFTGYTLDGGFADYMAADHQYCFPVPASFSDIEAAPLMCAGLIGYRAFRMVGSAKRIGLYGYGAAAHIITQVANYQGREIFAFTKDDDWKAQEFAKSLGAVWAGSSTQSAPHTLDAAIIFAPVGSLVPTALKAVNKGGTVVCAGIHMSDIPSFPYSLLWQERTLRSVANLTREDGKEFLEVAPQIPVKTSVHPYPLHKANTALNDLRHGRFEGAAVLIMNRDDAASA